MGFFSIHGCLIMPVSIGDAFWQGWGVVSTSTTRPVILSNCVSEKRGKISGKYLFFSPSVLFLVVRNKFSLKTNIRWYWGWRVLIGRDFLSSKSFGSSHNRHKDVIESQSTFNATTRTKWVEQPIKKTKRISSLYSATPENAPLFTCTSVHTTRTERLSCCPF